MTDKINKWTGLFDWWEKKSGDSKVLVILVIIISILGWKYWLHEVEGVKEIAELRKEVAECQKIKYEVERLKLQSLLVQSGDDQSPNAQWRTAAGTHTILWCNIAYEKKYLRPLGKTRKDLIGTDGSGVFTNEQIKHFKETNNRVVRIGKPIIEKEIIKTLKFPIIIGSYIYAVGGMEYEEDFSNIR